MAGQGETLFGLIRRQENIKFYAAQSPVPLPSQVYEVAQYPDIEADPETEMKQDLNQLDIQKKRHLVIPDRKGGNKLNKLSFLGFLIGLLITGAFFFIAGFSMCYSFYPPYGGILFEPKYATALQDPPLSSSSSETLDSSVTASAVTVPEQSYANRQAMLEHLEGKPSQPGLLEKAQQKTFYNAKRQMKDTMIQGIRSVTHKLSEKLGPTVRRFIYPLTEELPIDLAQQQASDLIAQPEKIMQSKVDPAALSSSPSLPGSSAVRPLKEASSSTPSSQAIPTTEKRGLYSLRVRKFNERESALKLSEELKRKGFLSYVIGLWNENHLVFEVRSGRYSHFSEAQNARKILNEQGLDFTTIVMVDPEEEPLKS